MWINLNRLTNLKSCLQIPFHSMLSENLVTKQTDIIILLLISSKNW